MTYTYKGKEYTVQEGAKGGKYFIDDAGKKHYLKNENAKPRAKKPEPVVLPTLKGYTAWFEQYDPDTQSVDDFKEWHNAYSKQEAIDYWNHEYHHLISKGLLTFDIIRIGEPINLD